MQVSEVEVWVVVDEDGSNFVAASGDPTQTLWNGAKKRPASGVLKCRLAQAGRIRWNLL